MSMWCKVWTKLTPFPYQPGLSYEPFRIRSLFFAFNKCIVPYRTAYSSSHQSPNGNVICTVLFHADLNVRLIEPPQNRTYRRHKEAKWAEQFPSSYNVSEQLFWMGQRANTYVPIAPMALAVRSVWLSPRNILVVAASRNFNPRARTFILSFKMKRMTSSSLRFIDYWSSRLLLVSSTNHPRTP